MNEFTFIKMTFAPAKQYGIIGPFKNPKDKIINQNLKEMSKLSYR